MLPWVLGVVAVVYRLSFPRAIGEADESFLLCAAARMLRGEVIYRDVFEFVAPLGYYFYAAVFGLGGVTLLAARVATASVEAVGIGLMFSLARRVADPFAALVAALVVPIVCIPAWPYASPHWLSTTLHLGVAAVVLSERGHASERLRPALAGLLAGAAVCVQQSRGLFIVVWAILATLVLAFDAPPAGRWRRVWLELWWLGAGGIGVTALVMGYAVWAASPRLVYAGVVEYVFGGYARAIKPVAWASMGDLAPSWMPSVWRPALRWGPAATMLFEAIALLWASRGGSGRGERVRLCLLLLAACAALSIWYFPDYVHVAFVLPFFLILGAHLLHVMGSVRWEMTVALSIGILAALMGEAGGNLMRAWRDAPRTFVTAFGTLQGSERVEQVATAVQRAVERDPADHRWLYVYPADAWLYLTTGARNPTRFSLLLPGLNSPAQVDEVLSDLRGRRPGTVVVNLSLAPATDVLRAAVEADYLMVEEVAQIRIYRLRAD